MRLCVAVLCLFVVGCDESGEIVVDLLPSPPTHDCPDTPITDQTRILVAAQLAYPLDYLIDVVSVSILPRPNAVVFQWAPKIQFIGGGFGITVEDDSDSEFIVVEVDENFEPIQPEYQHWIEDYDEVPRATDGQIKIYERLYGCLPF